jgi:hypothetical protein
MYGAFIRGGLTAVVAVFMGAVVEWLVPFFLPYQGPESGMMYQSFAWLGNNATFLMIIAVGAGVLARAAAESNAGI